MPNLATDAHAALCGTQKRVPKPSPLIVRLSVTSRCQLRCSYCLPEKDCSCPVPSSTADLNRAELVHLLRCLHACRGTERVRFTGGEPLLRRDLPDLVADVASIGIRDLALTTNAQLLAGHASGLKQAGLHRINISLDSLQSARFSQITRGGDLSRTLDGIAAARRSGFSHVKLNTVVMRGINDDEPPTLLRFALQSGCHIRFLELMPIGEAATSFPDRFVSSAETRSCLAESGFTLEPLPWNLSDTSRDYVARDTDGRESICGFISPTTAPFCDGCRRVRITCQGWLHGCLARSERYDLRPLLRMEPARAAYTLGSILQAAFSSKQSGERFPKTLASMAAIGG